ncbi:MAG: hypothetical protein Q8L45_14205 [Xanthomonadaceae bacterium]|nr:hypothetical protein [Xanthomonadaceae bacterium]MDP2186426.1 hypothetical protein [Xanthomonadales bacterium]MDZ4115462.1 hypothetical protein [Xanthomonadaceae bacterium]MDZ4376957.1 hypothetical protein [Xanthomonadaceae bacterium]
MDISYATEHAANRLNQRGIPGELLAMLLSYGDARHDGNGARVVAFSQRARRRLRNELGDKRYARWESRLNVYAVVSTDGALVTVGHRLHRLNRQG